MTDRKQRTIVIVREEVYRDIDSLTYKYAQASTTPSPKVENAISSDSTERLDGRLLGRNVEFRDAKLRELVAAYLDDSVEIMVAGNALVGEDPKIVYNLYLPVTFKDALLKSLATYIHRYLVWGALFDWYGAGMGSNQAAFYQRELEDLERDITNKINAVNVVKRPMQPFGPASKLRL